MLLTSFPCLDKFDLFIDKIAQSFGCWHIEKQFGLNLPNNSGFSYSTFMKFCAQVTVRGKLIFHLLRYWRTFIPYRQMQSASGGRTAKSTVYMNNPEMGAFDVMENNVIGPIWGPGAIVISCH